MRFGQGDRRLVPAQQCGISTAEAEYRLVGVSGDDGEFGARGQHPHQPGGLRIEMLRVVDKKQLDATSFVGKQVGVDSERFERRADEFGGAQRRHGGLRGRHPYRGAQQHDLFVGLCELAGGQPFGAARAPPDALQLNGIHAAFGAAGEQVAQFGGESDGAQRGPQLRRPGHGGGVAVLEITGEQFPDDAVLLRAGDQPRRRVAVALRRESQHRERI